MAKLAELIAAKEAEVTDHKRTHEGALALQRGLTTKAREEGRDKLTALEQADYERLRGEVQAAEKRHDAAVRALDELKLAAADEAKLERDADDVTETDAAKRQTGEVREQRVGYEKQGRVTSEPRTYDARSAQEGRSFFADVYRAQGRNDYSASDRLRRHMVEVEREGELTARALATGGAAGLVVPQYLVDLNAPALRAGRPFANITNKHQLPAEGMSFVIPRGTTGAAVAAQASENVAVQNTDEVWANLTVPVVTVAGQQQVSRQLLDRGTPGMDAIIYGDLARAYHAELDRQTIAGTGTGGTMLGLQNTAGIGAATAFGAAPTVTNFNLKVAGQQTAVASAGAGIQARVILMHPRRWGWLLGQVDSTGRPVVFANNVSNFNAAAVITEPGAYSGDKAGVDPLQSFFVGTHSSGLPVVTDLNVPSTVGTNSEDLVFVADNQEAHLWEDGDGMPRELRFEQTLGNQLTTTLVVAGYAAFTAGRYPAAVGKLGGLDSTATFGLVAPSF